MAISLEREIHNFSLRWVAWEPDVIEALGALCASPWHQRTTLLHSHKVNHGNWLDALKKGAGTC